MKSMLVNGLFDVADVTSRTCSLLALPWEDAYPKWINSWSKCIFRGWWLPSRLIRKWVYSKEGCMWTKDN